MTARAVGRGYTEIVRRRHLGRLEALDVAPVHPRGRGRGATRADHRTPAHHRRARSGRRGTGRALLPRRHPRLPPRQHRPVARLRPPRSDDPGPRRSSPTWTGAAPRCRRRTGARSSSSASTTSRSPGASRGARTSGGTTCSATISRPERSGSSPGVGAPTSRTSRRTERRSRAWSTSGGARQLALVPIEGGVPRVLTPGAPGFAYTPAFSPDGQAHRLLALEAGRLPRHPPLRSGRGQGSRAVRRSRDGHRSALLARRTLPAVLVGSHRHLRHLRLRARDRAALPGHQRA